DRPSERTGPVRALLHTKGEHVRLLREVVELIIEDDATAFGDQGRAEQSVHGGRQRDDVPRAIAHDQMVRSVLLLSKQGERVGAVEVDLRLPSGQTLLGEVRSDVDLLDVGISYIPHAIGDSAA